MPGLAGRGAQAVRERPRLQIAVLGGGVIVVAVGIALGALAIDRREWQVDDWAATVMAVALGFVFLGLAQWLQRSADRRSAAMATSALRGHIGQMITSGALSLGDVERTVEVGRHALTAVPLFEIASAEGQHEYLDAIEQVYGSMTLNVFPSSRTLPSAACKQLHADGAKLIRDLVAVAERPANRRWTGRLRELAGFVKTCLDLEEWFRQPGKDPPDLDVDTMRRLYREELRVYAAWSDPTVAAGTATEVAVYETDVVQLEQCFSPWYLRQDAHGYVEVDYSGKSLGGPPIVSERALPVYAEPLRHSTILALRRLRRESIEKMGSLLKELDHPVITVFLYRLAGSEERVVLDGNHRLAAALQLSQWDDHPAVVVFELQEGSAEGARLHHAPFDGDRSWSGFNPDVEHVRDVTARAARRALG